MIAPVFVRRRRVFVVVAVLKTAFFFRFFVLRGRSTRSSSSGRRPVFTMPRRFVVAAGAFLGHGEVACKVSMTTRVRDSATTTVGGGGGTAFDRRLMPTACQPTSTAAAAAAAAVMVMRLRQLVSFTCRHCSILSTAMVVVVAADAGGYALRPAAPVYPLQAFLTAVRAVVSARSRRRVVRSSLVMRGGVADGRVRRVGDGPGR